MNAIRTEWTDDLDVLESRRSKAEVDITYFTQRVRELRKARRGAANYLEDLRFGVSLAKAEYELALCRADLAVTQVELGRSLIGA